MPKLKPDDIRKWQNRINLSLAWRKSYEEVWDRIIDYLKNKYYTDTSSEDRICVNMVHPHVRVVIPAIYSRNPDIMVKAKKFDQESTPELVVKRAEVLQRILQYYLRELDIKTEIKLCLLDAILTGHAWIKTGYETEFENGEEVSEESETVVSKVLRSLGMKEEEEEEKEEDSFYYHNEKISSEKPWALRVSPYDMICPALSRRPEELYWIAERIILPYQQVLDNDDYDTKDLKPSANANQLLEELRGSKYKKLGYADEEEFSILYEIWDGITKQVITISDNSDKPLEVKDSEYTFLNSKYHPYVMLRFNEITDEFYPASDIEPAEPQLEELNKTRTQQITHKKRYNRRYISRPGAFDPQAKADLRSGEDGIIVEHSNTLLDVPLESIIQPVTDAPLPAEVYAVEMRIKDDIFTILGTSDYASQATGGARTATEASIIATQSRFRVEERIDVVGQFVKRIITNLAQISQKFMSPAQVQQIIGKDAIYWMQLKSRAEVQGEFMYDIVYASSAPINREVENEQFMKFFALARNDPYYDQVKLRLELARRFPNIGNPEDWLVPQIVELIEQQRLSAAKAGFLLEGVINAPGSVGRVPRPNGQGSVERLPTGQPRGLPGDVSEPSVPGGRGGTNLA